MNSYAIIAPSIIHNLLKIMTKGKIALLTCSPMINVGMKKVSYPNSNKILFKKKKTFLLQTFVTFYVSSSILVYQEDLKYLETFVGWQQFYFIVTRQENHVAGIIFILKTVT